MEFYKKHVLQGWYPNQYYGSPHTIKYTSYTLKQEFVKAVPCT